MTLKELHDLISNQLEFAPHLGEFKVVIPESKPSIGGQACVPVKSCMAGFDWDHGKFFIQPEKPMISKGGELC
jgi:hypothetical protein